MTYEDVLSQLDALSDKKFRDFSARLIKTNLPFIGVRTPALRQLAKQIKHEYTSFTSDFFARSTYSYEEIMLCGWQVGKDYATNVALLKNLIPRMDSWAHTDQIITNLKWVEERESFLSEFSYLKCGGEFEVRAYVMMLFDTCLTADGLYIIQRELPTIPLGKYYIDMAVAWMLCEMVCKFYEEGKALLSAEHLPHFVVRKALSKCQDSFRIAPEQKFELKKISNSLK